MNNYLNHICKNYLEIVKKAYNEKNVWIYVYLQSFVEKILKKYIVFKKAIAENELVDKNLYSLLKNDIYNNTLFPTIPDNYINSILELNSYANKVKHYYDSPPIFNESLIRKKIEDIDNFLFILIGEKVFNSINFEFIDKHNIENKEDIYIPFFGNNSLSGFIIKFKKNNYINYYDYIDEDECKNKFEYSVVFDIVYNIVTRGISDTKSNFIKEIENKKVHSMF